MESTRHSYVVVMKSEIWGEWFKLKTFQPYMINTNLQLMKEIESKNEKKNKTQRQKSWRLALVTFIYIMEFRKVLGLLRYFLKVDETSKFGLNLFIKPQTFPYLHRAVIQFLLISEQFWFQFWMIQVWNKSMLFLPKAVKLEAEEKRKKITSKQRIRESKRESLYEVLILFQDEMYLFKRKTNFS